MLLFYVITICQVFETVINHLLYHIGFGGYQIGFGMKLVHWFCNTIWYTPWRWTILLFHLNYFANNFTRLCDKYQNKVANRIYRALGTLAWYEAFRSLRRHYRLFTKVSLASLFKHYVKQCIYYLIGFIPANFRRYQN